MEAVPFLGWYTLDDVFDEMARIVSTHEPGKPAFLANGFVYRWGHFLGCFPVVDVGHDFCLHPFSDFFAEGDMCFVEVWRMPLLELVV